MVSRPGFVLKLFERQIAGGSHYKRFRELSAIECR